MKILKKIFQTIFRTSVLSLLIASSPFENHADNKVATIASHCIEEGQGRRQPKKKPRKKRQLKKKQLRKK